MSGYRVVIVIKGQWWSDGEAFRSVNDARRHRVSVAERWNDCDTAICAPDNRILFFRESLIEQRNLAEALAS